MTSPDTRFSSLALSPATLANLERLIQMGFKEGFTMTLNFLETLLAR